MPRRTRPRRAGAIVPIAVAGALFPALIGLLGAGPASASSPAAAGSYIVVLKTGADARPVANTMARHGVTPKQVLSSALNGYVTTMTTDQVAAVRADSRVAYVEPDGIVRATGQTLPLGVNRIDADLSRTRAGNGWGAVGLVNAYVIDSGISPHADLNIVGHKNWTGDGKYYDCNGHGTHVAGIIGAKDNASYVVGAAPGVALTDLKVLGCNRTGLTSNVIAAVDWVAANAKKPAVVNLSLSGPPSDALDTAVRNAAAKGVLMVIAAGNDGANACNYSPARAGAGTDNGIITVGATDASNAAASFSNYGPCVDIWAPGVAVLSTWNNGGMATMSGTSMAAPLVVGAGLLYEAMYKTTYMPSAERIIKSRYLATGKKSRDGRPIKIVYARSY
ncbi:MAG: S8 family peptidase [Mycobacteriales bacterium]